MEFRLSIWYLNMTCELNKFTAFISIKQVNCIAMIINLSVSITYEFDFRIYH